MRRLVRLAPILLLPVALAACSDAAGTAPPDPTTTPESATPAPSIAPSPTVTDPTDSGATTGSDAPAGASVTIAGFAFEPQAIEVSVGTTVTWTNEDSTAHTATVADGGPDTGSIGGGSSASLTFDAPGTYTYVCAFHPGSMTGTVVVQ